MATMRRKPRERTILFPWERTGSIFRRLGLARARPFAIALALVGVFVIFGARERTAIGVRSTRATLGSVRKAVDAYRADHDRACPAQLSELRTGGYLSFDPVDAWGRPLRLLCPGFTHTQSYDLMSDGPDGVFGGLDRIE